MSLRKQALKSVTVGRSFLPFALPSAFVVTLALLFTLTGSVRAQESEHETGEDETLEQPVKAPTNEGTYSLYNNVPESIRRTKPFARMLHAYMKYAGKEGKYDHEARLKAFDQAQQDIYLGAQEAARKISNGETMPLADAWVNVGPRSGAITGGCTNALAVDPKTTSIWYAGAAGGGVWKTTNSGVNWTPLTDYTIPNLAVSTIAVDPTNTSNVWVGSGDSYASSDGFGGSGLYKSTNGGLSWAKSGASTFTGTVAKVLVHPSKSNVVFASNYDNSKGLYRSTDAGATWKRVYPASSAAAGVVWDIVPGAVVGGTAVFYLVEGNNIGSQASSECGVYISIDDGATWSKLTSGLPTGTQFGRAALACPKNNATRVFMFAAKPDGTFLGLYRSTNNGNAWSTVPNAPSTVFQPNSSFGAQGWYDLMFGVSPSSGSNDTIFVGGVEAWYTRNSGTTWVQFSGYQDNLTVHVDHHSIEFDPKDPKKLMIGTDGGIYYSSNSGTTWLYRDTNYVTSRFYHIALDKNDNKVTWGGAQDQGTWKVTNGQGVSLKLGGDGMQPLVLPSNSNVGFGESPFGQIFKNSSGNVVQLGAGDFDDNADWDAPFLIGQKSPYPLMLGRTKVWRSNDQGTTWNDVSPALGASLFDPNVRALALSPANYNVMAAGFVSGKLFVTTNNGTNWADRSTTSSADITSIQMAPSDQNFMVISLAAASGNRVLYSTNQGTTWKAANGGSGKTLPLAPVRAIALDSTNPYNRWYAATDNGMYMTADTGKTWMNVSSGIGVAPCYDVRVHSNGATIRVATHGRGIWEGLVNLLPVELNGLRAVPTSSGTRLSWQTASETKNWGFGVMRSYNRQPFEQIGFVQGAGTSSTTKYYQFVDPMTDTGDYIFQLKQIDLDGTEHISNHVEVHYGAESIRLDQNFPNPFFVNATDVRPASTRIHYYLPSSDVVTLRIYDARGVIARTLLQTTTQDAGAQDVFWDGKSDHGENVGSGVYMYVLETQSGVKLWNKMVVVE